LGRHFFILFQQLVVGFDVISIFWNAVYRADLNTLRGVVMADTLGTEVGVDLIDLIALGDGAVGAFRFADVAVDAFVGDD
jgi:hypothetical protein